MSNTRDSSLWRSLAVAFGDGLAFGVGMKISQNAAARPAMGADSRVPELEERLRRIERTRELSGPGVDQRIVEGLVNGVEARLQEQSAQVERRIADLETRVAVELKTLDQQDRHLASNVDETVQALREQVVSLNREFAAQVARIVSEQVDAIVEKRFATIEERLLPLREELERKDREIAELRQKAQETDSAVFEFITSMGQMCRDAANRIGKTAAPPPSPPPPPDIPATSDAIAPPTFEELKRPGGLLRMPMVSSLIVAAGGVALLAHYL